MATHSSVLAWRIPETEEPGGLPSVGSHRVSHDRRDLAAAEAAEISVSDGRLACTILLYQILATLLSSHKHWRKGNLVK